MITNKKMRQSKQSINNQSDSPNLKNNRGQYKLKKEIDIKFNKRLRKDQINYSAHTLHHKQSSLLAKNPLTKSSFSLNDSITHKNQLKDTLQPIKKIVKSMSSKKFIALSFRQKYPVFDQKLFKTRASDASDYNHRSELKSDVKTLGKKYSCQTLTINRPNNKFKLLFKEKKTEYKSSSQRKISRIESKIDMLKKKKVFFESLIPIEKPKSIQSKAPPRIYNIKQQDLKQKIIKMSRQLIQTIQLYFNMYLYNNIVGGHIKNIEGYNKRIKAILMIDDIRAKRINTSQEIVSLFQVFKAEKGQNFLQEDLCLYNLLDIFLHKLQKRYKESLESFNYYQNKRRLSQKSTLEKTKLKFQKKLGRHEQINKINYFIENRLRFNQNRRQEYMQNLQKRGVILNIIERSRQIILRQNQNAVQNIL